MYNFGYMFLSNTILEEMLMINRHFFFDYARRPFRGRMTQNRSTGLNAILDACEATYAKKDDRCLPYALGTTHHDHVLWHGERHVHRQKVRRLVCRRARTG